MIAPLTPDLTTRATLFGVTLKLAQNLGLSEAEVTRMFSAENIQAGYEILRTSTPNKD